MSGIKTIEQQQYQRKVYSVSELNRRCKQTLESQFSTIWLEAEISNLAKPASGHWYFSLKDANSQVRCAMFKGSNRTCKFIPENGMKILVRARVSLFEPRGEFQLIVEYMEVSGAGQLLLEFEQLKTQLEKEGLFDVAAKQPVHHSYKRIAVITSPTGAAIHDVISVISRRFPLQQLVIYPCLVQGNQAANQIIKQIERANQRNDVDLILLVRGGGSLEDLWCFNDELLARTIHASQLPIVTGVGHEVDFTIADFVADLRAPTPSSAAERTTTDQRELKSQIESLLQWQIQFINEKIQNQSQKVDWLSRRLKTPEAVIREQFQQLKLLKLKMKTNVEKNLMNLTTQFRELAIKLDSLSPLATIARGYSITKTFDGKLIDNAMTVAVGDIIINTLKTGRLESQVTQQQADANFND